MVKEVKYDMKRDGALISLWQNKMPDYVSQTRVIPKETYDVVIVGGGITGITTALLLQKAGKKCLLAEAQTIGFGTSGGTTAHLNTMMDTPYNILSKNFGEENAQKVALLARTSIDLVKTHISEYNIECDFSDQTGYLFSQDDKQAKELKDIFEASATAGCDVAYSDTIPVPINFTQAVAFRNQAQFHPAKYFYALAKAYEAAGGILIQQCRVTTVKKNDLLEIETECGKVRSKKLIYATHVPPGVNLLHFRCAPYRSYAMALKLAGNKYPDGLAYDMYDPYHYYRTQEIDGEKFLIAGGEDHKTAHEENTESCFTKLESYLRQYFKIDAIPFRWSSQYFEPTDGLPYIGQLPGNPDEVMVATGFGGNGMIYSHIAAMVLTDLIVKGDSEYKKLFDPGRIKPVAGFSNFVKEAADVVGNLAGKWFVSSKIREIAELAHGEARVVKYEGQSIALYKDENGGLHAVDPACTHINCKVAWNTAEKTWDCPCHGSRFNADGIVFTAPARKDLAKIDLKELLD
jgi:glycine/D-amino acid oxidase-like deaminating enzyme/nitrite reductase/ring-hydroxylating ferredoxin subunit